VRKAVKGGRLKAESDKKPMRSRVKPTPKMVKMRSKKVG